jgi:hypothetical protein
MYSLSVRFVGIGISKVLRNPRLLQYLLLVCFAYATNFAISTSSQLPLDLHAFRQSQTALSAYWLDKSPNVFSYYTPIIGSPWSIPFEFPTYQIIVNFISSFFGLPLIQTGRILSFIFLCLVILPVRIIVTSLGLDKRVTLIVSMLTLTSSIYLYWSRAFLIETLALLLTIVYIAFMCKYFKVKSYSTWFLTIVFGILAGITKSTTATSGFIVALIILFISGLQYVKHKKSTLLDLVFSSLLLIIPVFFSLIWVRFTDQTKSLNVNGQSLTSDALSRWNFGTLSQRFSSSFWYDLILQRTILGSLGAGLGLILVIYYYFSFYSKQKVTDFYVTSISIFLFFSSLVLFSNLHIVHWYYQSGSQIYLFFALAIILTGEFHFKDRNLNQFNSIFLIIILVLNLSVFMVKFEKTAYVKFSSSNSLIIKVADYIKINTRPDENVLVYGLDWSSELAFASERKSATLTPWMEGYDESYRNPASAFGGENPGAIVDCIWPVVDRQIRPTRDELAATSSRIGLKSFALIDGVCGVWIK